MTKDEALQVALEACPFCGGEAEYHKDSVRYGYGEYERNETYHAIKCKKCGSSSKRIHQKHLIDFTKYTVSDFRENPILRAKVEDDYDAYCEQAKQIAIDAWNFHAPKQQPDALAKKPEPVGTAGELFSNTALERLDFKPSTKIYTTPLQRTWQGLTEDDKVLIKHDANYNQFMTADEYADRVQQLTEARLKDKNT